MCAVEDWSWSLHSTRPVLATARICWMININTDTITRKKSSVSFKLNQNDNNIFTRIRKLCLLAKKDQQFTRCERNSRKGRRKRKGRKIFFLNCKSTQRDYLVKRTYFGLRSTPTLSRPMPDVQGSLPMATRIWTEKSAASLTHLATDTCHCPLFCLTMQPQTAR